MDENKLLDKINSPSDIKKLNAPELYALVQEIRELIIETVSQTGGHLSSSLGSVELTLALHYVFDSPHDIFIWDVGHQCYTHKIITGRRNEFHTLRQFNGLSGFPNPAESVHDHFIAGHGSTAISQGLGVVSAGDILGEKRKVVAIVGDASLVGGMAFEALNYLGHIQKDLLIILNDNEWAISKTIGAISRYLNRIITNPLYNKVNSEFKNFVLKLPKGEFALKAMKKFEESLKNLITPGIIFEEMGINYIGPIDGHNIEELIATFKNIKEYSKPVIVHVLTKKGKGYLFSEKAPDLFHSAAPFHIDSGCFKKTGQKTYTDVFSQTMIDLGITDSKVAVVTAAMPHGTGLQEFKSRFPERFFDVGMAEQNAVTFAAGLAKEGLKPYVAIYSTFIQRGYDQIMHDVCLQGLGVRFCLDRAGLVGRDGPTHHGIFDIAFLKPLPRIVLLAPKDGWEFTMMLQWMKDLTFPAAIRYPKSESADFSSLVGYQKIHLGRSELLLEGEEVAILAYGAMVDIGYKVSKILSEQGRKPYLVNLRFAKPLDETFIKYISGKVKLVVTLEEGAVLGGVGESVSALLSRENIHCKTFNFGIPDNFITHGGKDELFKLIGLDEVSIAEKIKILLTEDVWQK